MAKALDFIRNNENEAKKLLPKYTPLELEVAQRSDLYKFYKMEEPFDMDAVQKLADLLYEYKILTTKIEVRGMFLTKEQID